MSLQPQLKRVILPPGDPLDAKTASPVAQRTACFQKRKPISDATVRLSTIHPVHPWIAYVRDTKWIIVQNTVTREIVYEIHWHHVAAAVYGEQEGKKLPAAAKSLGTILSLSFYDVSTLFWSRLYCQSTMERPYTRWHSLAVQTERRVILLNLRRGATSVSATAEPLASPKKSLYRIILAHLNEKTVNSVPSSNVLPLTDRWLLVGCADGSMKCYDWTTNTTVKKIKGLGKGDFVIQLLPANTYRNTSTVKRILTVTKKGTVFLLELKIDAAETSLEIMPPMARFATDNASNEAILSTEMEHCTYSFDAHNDRFQWYVPSKKEPRLYVWDLKQCLVEVSTGPSSSIAKPDPTLIIPFPAVSSCTVPTHTGFGSLLPNQQAQPEPDASVLTSSQDQPVTVVPGLVHAAFGSDDTVVSLTVTASGDVCLHGIAVPQNQRGTTKIDATPVCTVQTLAEMILMHGVDAPKVDTPVRVMAVGYQPLAAVPTTLAITTNWGIAILELPMNTNPKVPTPIAGTRHLHFGTGLGSLGKSMLFSRQSGIHYGSIDIPIGKSNADHHHLEAKNTFPLYESPLPQHMPPEFSKRSFRLAPLFVPSPSGIYLALFWPAEFRYEILHLATLLQGVGQQQQQHNRRNHSVVASGTGVASFCWVTDNDTFCLLHAPDLQAEAAAAVPRVHEESPGHFILSPLGAVASTVTKTAIGVPLSATKVATTAAVNTTMTAANMTVGVTTKAIRSGAKGVTMGVKKSLGIFGKKKKTDGSIMTADDQSEAVDDTDDATSLSTPAMTAPLEALKTPTNAPTSQVQPVHEQKRSIEFRSLEAIDSKAAVEGGIPPATCTTLGELGVRTSNRAPPVTIFGGPVLCVATKSDLDDGQAYFYTTKPAVDGAGATADNYTTAGPVLPFPDLLQWDDEGSLCAIVVGNRVAVYQSQCPGFTLLGTSYIASQSVQKTPIQSLKFVHGALFCCTWNSIHCVLLGDLQGSVCMIDSYLIACTEVSIIPESNEKDVEAGKIPFQAAVLPVPLCMPSVLGIQTGSLIVSTLRGVHAVPLNSVIMRVGLLLSAGQSERAARWLDAIDDCNHEAMAKFLERRSYPEMVLRLTGVSLLSKIDVCMRHGFADELEDIVERFGVQGLQSVDKSQGCTRSIFGPERDEAQSVVVLVGAYLLAHGRVELVRRMVAELLRIGFDGRKDAFMLATLLLPVDESDARRLMQRSVLLSDDSLDAEWSIGRFTRKYLLHDRM